MGKFVASLFQPSSSKCYILYKYLPGSCLSLSDPSVVDVPVGVAQYKYTTCTIFHEKEGIVLDSPIKYFLRSLISSFARSLILSSMLSSVNLFFR